MEHIYTMTKVLLGRDVDLFNRWRLENLFETLQVAGLGHIEALGCGYEAMLANNVAWVLGRLRLEVYRWPGEGEKILLQTWPCRIMHTLFPRYYGLFGEDGQKIAQAETIWAVMDLSTRQMRGPESLPVAFPQGEETRFSPSLRRMTPQEEYTVSHPPVYNDYDRNGHVNNARYSAWFCDGVPLDYQQNHQLAGMQIAYSREIRVGEGLNLTYGRAGDSFSCRGEYQENHYFLAQGVYRPVE